jgi:hypothetical protein
MTAIMNFRAGALDRRGLEQTADWLVVAVAVTPLAAEDGSAAGWLP